MPVLAPVLAFLGIGGSFAAGYGTRGAVDETADGFTKLAGAIAVLFVLYLMIRSAKR